jgi:cellulose synthase/poly-beta-1,6-N-acetylglucosamine synthase-like glycosyltransferase
LWDAIAFLRNPVNSKLTTPTTQLSLMSVPGLVFKALLVISFAIPLVIIIAGIRGQVELFLGLSVFIVGYNVWQSLFIAGLPRLCALRPRLQRQIGAIPSIAVIIPAWNEQAALPKTLATVLEQDDNPDAIIVADDGSTDQTLARLKDLYDIDFQGQIGRSRLYSNLQVLRKEHTGKGDSINQAVALTDADVVLTLDADTRLSPGSIHVLRRSFTQYSYLHIVAGTVIPYCSKSLVGRGFQFFQQYEYARAYLWRLGWSYLNGNLNLSGACAAFRRQTLLSVGGFDPTSWTEDYEIIHRLQRYLRQRQQTCWVMVQPNLCVATEAPNIILSFLRQRRRWAGGFLETLLRYRQMVGNHRFGLLGCVYLVHNAFTIAHPFYTIAWIIGGFILYFQDKQIYVEFLWLLLITLSLEIILMIFSVGWYRYYFGRREVSRLGGILELILRPLFYNHLLTLSYVWGYWSYLRRKKSW